MSDFKISRRKIDLEKEKNIIKNLIIDDEYIKQILPIADKDLFETPYVKTIIKWINGYYEKYQEAPKQQILDIYNTKKNELAEADAELIGDFLEQCSQEYAREEKTNTKFNVDQAVPYLKSRSYISLGERLQSLGRLENPNECEEALINHKNIDVLKAQYNNLNDPEIAKQIMLRQEKNKLFRMPGVLGELLGDFEAGRMYGVLGKTNIGKSFFLRELLFQGMLNGYKGVEFNWEQTLDQVGIRYYRRLTSRGSESKIHDYPIVDCQFNQDGTCQKPERINKIRLLNSFGELPSREEVDKNYKTCSVCRGGTDYKFASWWQPIYREELTLQNTLMALGARKINYGDNFRTKCFHKFTGTAKDAEHELEMMNYFENFVANIAIFDYDGIIAPEHNYRDPRHGSDEIYKRLGGITQKWNLCSFIGMQVNREGAKKKKSSTFDVGEDFRKICHLDSVIILNQSDFEKERNIVRVSLGKQRDGDFHVSKDVVILQNLAVGQVLLDSEYLPSKDEE